jgi:hypothetical protein
LNRTRALAAFALALAAALLLAACGGGGNNEDPQQVLNQTFSNPKSIQSGTFDLDVKIETSGGSSPGKLEAKLGGRFQSRGNGQFPEFDFDVSLRAEGGSQTISGTGGLISTGDKAFVKFQGTDYAVPQALYDEFVASYAQLQGQNGSKQGTGLLQSLGISVTDLITDLKNEGTVDVEGTKTIHVSGTLNVPKLVDDLKAIAQRAGRSVGNFNPDQLNRLNDTIQSGDVDVYSGENDRLLRRLDLSFLLKPPPSPGAPDSLTIDVELNLADVNKPQTVLAPASAQPLQVLLQQRGINLGNLGNSLRGGLGTGGALPQSGGSTTAPSPSATQAYQQCLSQARGQAAIQRCANLLSQ